MRRTARGRRRLAVVLAAVVVLVVAATIAVLVVPSGRPGPSVTLAPRGGLVVATGHDFPPAAPAVVSARLDGGSGQVRLTTAADGGFEVAFRPPAGFTGEVEVSAVAGDDRARRTTSVAPDDADSATPAPGGLVVVPTTGAPAVTTIASPPPGMPEYTVPEGIADDCSADVTSAVNDWLGSVPDGSQVTFGRGACYRIDGSLRLTGRNDLVIEGNGATYRAGVDAPAGTNRAQWYLEYGSGIALRNMTLVGVNPRASFDLDHEWDHNLFIRGTHTVAVENVHGRNAYGDFIAVAQGADGTTIPSDITIRRVSADTVGRMGISCVACDRLTVEDSVFNDIAYHVFDLEIQGDDWPGRGVTYTGNTIGAHGWAFFSVGTPYQTHDNDLSDVRIVGNTMTMPSAGTGNCLPAISFRSSKIHADGVTITGNTLISHTDGIWVRRASDVTIRDNTAELVRPACGDPVGIRVTEVDGVDVAGNRMTGYRRTQAIE